MKTQSRENYYKILKKIPYPAKDIGVNLIYLNEKRRLKKIKTPAHLIFFVTQKCNLKCSHCFYWRHLNKSVYEMSLEEIIVVIKSLKNRLESVIITGGEPFLRKDLVEICKAFEKYNHTKKIIIATNGTLPEEVYNKTKQILSETSLDFGIQLSLDGLEKTHDEIRGVKGCFKNVVNTVNKLKEFSDNKNFNLAVSTTISKTNVKELDELIEFVKKDLNVLHGMQFMRNSLKHSFCVPPEILADFDSEKGLLSVDEMEKINEQMENLRKNNEDLLTRKINKTFNEYIISILRNKKPVLKCLAGKIDGVIYSDGNVSMCEFTKPFANLKYFDFDFYKLWNSKQANEAREKIRNCFCIHSCNLINSMRYDKKSLKKIFS